MWKLPPSAISLQVGCIGVPIPCYFKVKINFPDFCMHLNHLGKPIKMQISDKECLEQVPGICLSKEALSGVQVCAL